MERAQHSDKRSAHHAPSRSPSQRRRLRRTRRHLALHALRPWSVAAAAGFAHPHPHDLQQGDLAACAPETPRAGTEGGTGRVSADAGQRACRYVLKGSGLRPTCRQGDTSPARLASTLRSVLPKGPRPQMGWNERWAVQGLEDNQLLGGTPASKARTGRKFRGGKRNIREARNRRNGQVGQGCGVVTGPVVEGCCVPRSPVSCRANCRWAACACDHQPRSRPFRARVPVRTESCAP